MNKQKLAIIGTGHIAENFHIPAIINSKKFKKKKVNEYRIEILKSNMKVIKFWKKFNIKEKSKIYIFND